jgi:hypothetical protein
MSHYPKCHYAAHARTSRYFSDTTKERYHQCTNINCSCTFVTTETVERFYRVTRLSRASATATAPDNVRPTANSLDVTNKKAPQSGAFLYRCGQCVDIERNNSIHFIR